jgi:hypothetical protein
MTAAIERAGEISIGSIYTLAELDHRLGLGKAAIRKARREGLIVRRIGRKSFVLGEDLIAWFKASARPV